MQIEIVDPARIVVKINARRVMDDSAVHDQAVLSALSDVFYRNRLVKCALPFLTAGRRMPGLFVALADVYLCFE